MARIKREGKGREGKDTLKTHKSVIFHTRVAKAPTMRSSPNLAHLLSDLRNDLCKVWLVLVEGWALCGCTQFTIFHDFNALQQANINVLP